ETEHSRFPASSDAMNAAAQAGEDFTYGTAGIQCFGPSGFLAKDAGFATPSSTQAILAQGTAGPLKYQTNNAELMAILLDLEYYQNGAATINKDHVKNPQKIKYLNAKLVTDTVSPGVGSDGVYRDPWGNPYIITLDLNNDEKARDGFYRDPKVSA